MIQYVYDGSPDGLICAVATALRDEAEAEQPTDPHLTAANDFQPSLFGEVRTIASDRVLSRAFLRLLAARLNRDTMGHLLFCFHSGEAGMEDTILDYTRLLLGTGGRAHDDWTDETVRKARQLSGRVGHEIHRLHGFIRFRRLADGTYYAPVEPDHALLALLAPHFAARFVDQRWIIHDLRRNTGIYYDGEGWFELTDVSLPLNPLARTSLSSQVAFIQYACQPGNQPGERLSGWHYCSIECNLVSKDERVYQDVWREYFQRIAIPERRNPVLQRQRLPVRYWGNMTEMRE